MKTKNNFASMGMRLSRYLIGIFGLCLIVNSGCHDDDNGNSDVTPASTSTGYQEVRLVADTAGYGAGRIDTNLRNAWGIAIGPTGNLWIAANGKNVAVVYDRNGATQRVPIVIATSNSAESASPTGLVYNATSDFVIPATGEVSKFIFAGEDGTLFAWSSGDSAKKVADRSASGAVYKAVTIANEGAANFLYVANFKGSKIDVFDQNFNYVTNKPFSDPTIPAGFAPFNIENINGKLYVTYAKQKGPDNEDDEAGLGNGYVNIFNTNGTLVKRFASAGLLNSPWGIAKAPSGFGQFKNSILIGNFGNGRINAFDSTGVFLGQLEDNGTTIVVEGLWAITFPKNNIPAGNQNQFFFTAGPNDEEDGIFGYIQPR